MEQSCRLPLLSTLMFEQWHRSNGDQEAMVVKIVVPLVQTETTLDQFALFLC